MMRKAYLNISQDKLGGLLIVSLLLTNWSSAPAQQRVQYTQYINTQFLINPAVAGASLTPEFRTGTRQQWVGFVDAPRSYYITGQAPISLGQYARGRTTAATMPAFHALGGVALREQTGPISRTSAYLSYAYNQPIGRGYRAALGITAGLEQFAFDASNLILAEASTTQLTSLTRTYPDIGVGGWLYGKGRWVGASILHVMRNQFATFDYSEGIYRAERHIFLTGGLRRKVSTEFTLLPSVLVKYVPGLPLSADLSIRARYKNMLWFGTSLRTSDALAIMAGLTVLERMDVSYTYDAVFSGLNRYQQGSHELSVGYRILNKKRGWPQADFWR